MPYIDNLRMFVRIFELGGMSAAARDQRTSPAVASSRIVQLEDHLGVRLFLRTTRSLQPTEQGRIFYGGARRVLETIEEAEAAIMEASRNPRGRLSVAAPFAAGRLFVAPEAPGYKAAHPLADVRLRMSDRHVDVIAEGLDVAFMLGYPEDSSILDSDDGDVLTGWALGGHGVVLKPVFEVAEHLESGALIPVASRSPPPASDPCLPLRKSPPSGSQDQAVHRLHGEKNQAQAQSVGEKRSTSSIG